MRAPRFVRRRRLIARLDARLEQLRAACFGSSLAAGTWPRPYNAAAVGRTLGLSSLIGRLEVRRTKLRGRP